MFYRVGVKLWGLRFCTVEKLTTFGGDVSSMSWIANMLNIFIHQFSGGRASCFRLFSTSVRAFHSVDNQPGAPSLSSQRCLFHLFEWTRTLQAAPRTRNAGGRVVVHRKRPRFTYKHGEGVLCRSRACEHSIKIQPIRRRSILNGTHRHAVVILPTTPHNTEVAHTATVNSSAGGPLGGILKNTTRSGSEGSTYLLGRIKVFLGSCLQARTTAVGTKASHCCGR